MLTLPAELTRRYEALLRQQGVAREHRPYYMKWLCYYWDFCHKYGFKPRARQSFPPFDEKLRTKKQSDVQRQQARHAVALYYALVLGDRDGGQRLREKVPVDDSDNTPGDVGGASASPTGAAPAVPLVCSAIACETGPRKEEKPQQSLHLEMSPNAPSPHARQPVGLPRATLEPPVQPLPQATPRNSAGSTLAGASWVWVYDSLHSAIKVRHYSTKTLQAYKAWTQKFQTFTKSKDPERVTMDDVKGFLSFLAVDKKVAASSQNQAFNALLFLFKHVLEKQFENVEGVVRAKRTKYISVVCCHGRR